MSLDPRSRERLEALGRQLPRKLPPPEPKPAAVPPADAGPRPCRHPVETEVDPRRLFRELMDVSPDGTVPPHLLERLRQLETGRAAAGAGADRPAVPDAAAPRRAPIPAASEERALYDAFADLLQLQAEEAPEAPGRSLPTRPADDRLRPRPTERRRRPTG
jgi:hypothetical protein